MLNKLSSKGQSLINWLLIIKSVIQNTAATEVIISNFYRLSLLKIDSVSAEFLETSAAADLQLSLIIGNGRSFISNVRKKKDL